MGEDDTAASGSARTLTAPPVEPEVRANAFVDAAGDPNRYAIISELARGGGGRIAIAIDRKLGRRVALKRALGREGEARLEREALVLARLEHPAIVPIDDAGYDTAGSPYYAMKLLGGRDLAAEIAAATTFEQRLAMVPAVTTVADAMAHAHGQGVIHRDLKPGNVLVGEFAEISVIDWGLGKVIGVDDDDPLAADPSADASLTKHGMVVGTPAYMAPEQGRGEDIDERVDVYAIGAMLYHVLAGDYPYGKLDTEATLVRLLDGPPPPVEEREPRVPSELAAIVAKATARERDRRYPSARELAEDLHRYQTGRLVAAHRYAPWVRGWRFVRRHRTALAFAVALAASVIAVVLFLASTAADKSLRAAEQANKLRSERAAAELAEKEQARAAAARSQAGAEADRQKAEREAADKGHLVDETREELKDRNRRLEAALREATVARELADRASKVAGEAAAATQKANNDLQQALDREHARRLELEAKKHELSTTLK